MFSRVALHTGALRPGLTLQLQSRVGQCASVRCASTDQVENWKRAHKIYYGPDRDTKNYPVYPIPETHPPVRLGFIPESFFKAFYEKTGVTGPYMFGIGLTTYLLSKEIWVVEHGFTEFIAFWLGFYYLQKKLGPGLKDMLDKDIDLHRKNRWDDPLNATLSTAKDSIKEREQFIENESGQKYLFEAKRENADLQLEASYRQRLADVHQAVKKRLDYQVDTEYTKRRFEHSHMVNWIVKNAIAGITPQQEKQSLSKCIQDLKGLSAHA